MNAGGTGSSETVYFELTDAFTSAPFPKGDSGLRPDGTGALAQHHRSPNNCLTTPPFHPPYRTQL